MDQPRDRLIDAARTLFAQKGFHSSPMSELASVARVSVGQIYRLFDDKNAIIRAIVEKDVLAQYRLLESLGEQVEAGSMSPQQGLEEFAMISLSHPNQGLIYEFVAEGYRNPAVAEIIREVTHEFRRHLRRLVRAAQPGISEGALDAAEDMLLSLNIGTGNRELTGSRLAVPEAVQCYSKMLLGAFAALDRTKGQ
ncbi:TetR/AcrR family transcriptional regulator [Sphingomonas sp.]|uniref:TetR/AcrR family transcriptional regulator n=1 Tax=Sphingomonas sp. TaxID=28214 RepID=UPI003B3A45B5